jgi:hypothetical protein
MDYNKIKPLIQNIALISFLLYVPFLFGGLTNTHGIILKDGWSLLFLYNNLYLIPLTIVCSILFKRFFFLTLYISWSFIFSLYMSFYYKSPVLMESSIYTIMIMAIFYYQCHMFSFIYQYIQKKIKSQKVAD